MLTAGELTAMQAAQVGTLVEPCSIMRRTLASDGAGGQTETTSSTVSMCRLAPSNNLPQDRQVAGSNTEQVVWRITLPADVQVSSDDRIQIGSRTFEVRGVYAPHSLATAVVCVCVER